MSDFTHLDMVRAAPVRSLLVTGVPVVLALAQLANSFVNDLSLVASVAFALVVVGFGVLLTQYNFVRLRRHRLESRPVA